MKKLLFISFLFYFLLSNLFSQSNNPDEKMWITNGPVNSIVSNSTHTYLGGDFDVVGPRTGYGVILDKKGELKSFPEVNGPVYTSENDGSGGWFIGGDFTKVGAYTRNNIAHILSDGTVDPMWNPNANGVVKAIVKYWETLYVGGEFTNIGGQNRNYIARLSTLNFGTADSWNPNANGVVNAIALFIHFDPGYDVYVGGEFTSIGGLSRNYLAKLSEIDGSAFSEFDAGLNGIVTALAVYTEYGFGCDVYIGGEFTDLGKPKIDFLAKLHGNNGSLYPRWNPELYSDGDQIFTIALNDTNIYVGGKFESIGGLTRRGIGKIFMYDGSGDSKFNPNSDHAVFSITFDGEYIYVGGYFIQIGGLERKRIAKLNEDGTADSDFNPSAGDWVRTISFSGTDFYVGGDFTSINGVTRNNIARLSNTTGEPDSWNPNANHIVNTLALAGSYIYVGGDFTQMGGLPVNYACALGISGIEPMWYPNPNGPVQKIYLDSGYAYVSGWFTTIGGLSRSYIAKCNTSDGAAVPTWNANASNIVYDIISNGSYIYVGGQFTSIGGQSRKHIARLYKTNGTAETTWNPDANNPVYALQIYHSPTMNDFLWVGGAFTSITGGTGGNYIALFNLTGIFLPVWLNNDANGFVKTITNASSSGDIYVGGEFTHIGGTDRNYLAKMNLNGSIDADWNPSPSWYVNALNVNNSFINVGGSFQLINGEPQSYYARFKETDDLKLNLKVFLQGAYR